MWRVFCVCVTCLYAQVNEANGTYFTRNIPCASSLFASRKLIETSWPVSNDVDIIELRRSAATFGQCCDGQTRRLYCFHLMRSTMVVCCGICLEVLNKWIYLCSSSSSQVLIEFYIWCSYMQENRPSIKFILSLPILSEIRVYLCVCCILTVTRDNIKKCRIKWIRTVCVGVSR